MSATDLENLEYLSLVARITQEVVNHTGINDKTLAEFVIALHEDSKTRAEFKQKLVDVGANFPDSFVDTVDRLILSMHPKHKKRQPTVQDENFAPQGVTVDETDKKRRMFPGLAVKDQEWQPSITKDVLMKEVDDMMSQIEGVATKAKLSTPVEEVREVKRRRRSSRSRSPGRRSPSPPRGRGYARRDFKRGRPELDEKPVLYKIYSGRVAGLKDFGAFVQLDGIVGRVEGEHFHHYWVYPRTHVPFYRYGSRLQYSTRG